MKALNVPIHDTPVGLVACLPPMIHVEVLGLDWPVAVGDVLGVVTKCERCKGTGNKPRPEGWDQSAHLYDPDRKCECHDSWDQCPCADGGHFPNCGCCPGGTGLCGPLPCESCGGTGYAPLTFVKVLNVWPIMTMTQASADRQQMPFVITRGPGGLDVLAGWPDAAHETLLDLPDAVPGGVALHVEWTACPTCDGRGVRHVDGYGAVWGNTLADALNITDTIPCPTCQTPTVEGDGPIVEVAP